MEEAEWPEMGGQPMADRVLAAVVQLLCTPARCRQITAAKGARVASICEAIARLKLAAAQPRCHHVSHGFAVQGCASVARSRAQKFAALVIV